MDATTQLRVVSLLPGVTETICILGFQGGLVGRSHNCKWPPTVLSVPCVSCPATDVQQAPCDDLDDEMVVVKGLSPYCVDLERLKELRPEVIFTKDQWQACGVSFEDLKRATGELIWGDGRKCRIISFKPRIVEDIFSDIQMVADVFSLKEKGENLVRELKTRWKRVKEATPQWADGVPLISVACFQSFNPLMGTGYWIPEIVSCAGGLSVLSQVGYPGPVLAWEDVQRADPDVIVIIFNGVTMAAAAKEMLWLESEKGWDQLRSVIAKRVFLVNGDRFLSDPGPNIVESAELFAELLHGIDFGYEGMGFIRWEGTASLCRFNGEWSELAVRGSLLVSESPMQDPNVSIDHSSVAIVYPEQCYHEDSDALQMSPNSWLLSERNPIISTETCCTEPTQRDGQWNMQMDASEPKQPYLSDAAGKNDNNVDGQFMSASQKEFTGFEVANQSGRFTLPDVNYSKKLVDFQSSTFTGNKMTLTGFDMYLDYLDEDDDIEVLAKRWKKTLDSDGLENPSKFCEMNSSKKTPAISTHTDRHFNSQKPEAGIYWDASLSDPKYPMLTSRRSWNSERELFTKMWRSTKAAAKFRSSNAHVSSFRNNITMSRMGKPPVREKALSEVSKNSTSFLSVASLESSFGHQFEGLNKHFAGSCTTANSKSGFSGLMLLSERSWVLRRLICMALEDTLPADCLLLSGGLNSGILAEAAPLLHKGGFKAAITVLSGPTATDAVYAGAVAKRCSMDHIVVGGMRCTAVELLEQEIDFVIKVMRTFDPLKVRCCVALAAALREAKNQGFQSVVSGDGADELFAGHPFMQEMTESELKNYRQSLGSALQFAAVPLGAALGIQVRLPYMHPKVIEYALGLNSTDLLGPEKGSLVQGKWVLREAFHDVLSAWRKKDPIEVGTGMSFLAEYFSKCVSASYLEEETKRISAEDKVQIRDAEHLKYYLAFKRVFKNDILLQMERWSQNPCCACGYELKSPTEMFCLTCGQYPAQSNCFREEECSMNGDVESQSKLCSFDDESGSHNVVGTNCYLNQAEHDGKLLSLIDEVMHRPHHSTKHSPVPPPLSECEGTVHLLSEFLPKSTSSTLFGRQQEDASLGITGPATSKIDQEGLTTCFERLSLFNDTGHFGGNVISLHQEHENKSENPGEEFVAKENQISYYFSKGNNQASYLSVPGEKIMNVTRKRKAEHIAKKKFWWGLGAGSAAFFLWSHLCKW